MDQQELRRLAQMGAAARLAELERERAALLRIFPGLQPISGSRSEPAGARGATGAAPARRRRTMSAANRKAVSQRMKRYWAERRKTKASKAAKA